MGSQPEAFTAKRGRPTAEQAQALSRAIVTAATELFLTEGFEATSMDAVASRVGVPKSTLYKRYGDKRGLLRVVLEERVAGWAATVDAMNVRLTDDLAQRLTHYVTAMVEWASTAEVQAFIGLATTAWSDAGTVQDAFDVIGSARMIDLLEHDIREYGPALGCMQKIPVASPLT